MTEAEMQDIALKQMEGMRQSRYPSGLGHFPRWRFWQSLLGLIRGDPEKYEIMTMPYKPSMTIWIDPQTQVFKIDFHPQELSPAQYGVVIASIMIHLSRMFAESSPMATEADAMMQIRRGMEAGLAQIQDVPLPAKQH